ncbi:MAG TPA: M36 family metallopeptidase [Saprospiraceae bacterium]|nr:M36 family metallopeptidase [Saprospiraceae bacterium]
MKKLLLFFACVHMTCMLFAQIPNDDPAAIALDHLRNQRVSWGLESSDLSSLRVTDMYTSAHNGVTHVYYVQQYNGVDIAQGTYSAHIQNGKVIFAGDRLMKNIASRITNQKPALSPEQAVSKALDNLGSMIRGPLTLKERVNAQQFIFNRGVHALEDFPVRLVYVQSNDQLVLAWEVTLEPAPSGDLWSMKVDATTGDILAKQRLTIHCTFPDHYLANPHHCTEHEMTHEVFTTNTAGMLFDGAQYNVVPIPNESPNHGPRAILVDPSDVDASPQGWHDTDGIPGAEFTITRGNNAHAFLDRNGDNTPDVATDGGADLIFDFNYDNSLEPDAYMDAAATNLFYMNNIMHDFAWHYGFDEFSGNFQETNFSGLGIGGDYVLAHAQYGADLADPPLNNATFGTPGDGGSGRMRMYLWSQASGNRYLRVESPSDVLGTYQTSTTTTDWGAAITAEPLTGEVIIVNDGSGNPTQGCNDLVNASEVAGKIALIDRGSCEFGRKALRAQTAGAIGFIICNFEEGYVNMAAGADGSQVTIPGIFISNSDCQKLRVFAGSGLIVSFVNEEAGTGPAQRDGSLDNSVISHEYGHGISNRLTGGPANAGCLFNYDHDNNGTPEDGEQMGEGWSDYFALVTTVRPGDTKDVPRGIATYATGQDTNGVGLRSYAYSPNMIINPLTYDDIAFQSVPHGIGTVWCTVLWDMYWALVDKYGYDPDLYRGTGGNNLAIQLVMDGMKLQVCNPGLIDGRDAILAAELALTGGENQLLLWQVFARRGLGFSADQGEERFRHDNTEAFDINPFVVKELKVVKHMTPFIERGETIDIELWAVNHKASIATDVVVTDMIPAGATFVGGSSSHAFDLQGDVMMFDIDSIASGDTTKITYRISSDANLFSERYFKDDVEGDFFWQELIEDWPILLWQPQTFVVNRGTYAWGMENIDTTVDQSIVLLEPVTMPANQPALMFYQNYDTERFFDAGIVQISDDGGLSWDTPGESKIIRGDYSTKVAFSLFAIPRLKAWTGQSDGWVQTVVDLSDYAGKDILIRFRFASDGNTSGVGWFIDDIELIDLFNYNSEACINSAEGDEACAEATRRGTLVASDISVGTDDTQDISFELNVFPNPSRNFVTVDITSESRQHAEIILVNNAGQRVWSEKTELPVGAYSHSVDTRSLPKGFYFIRVQGERDQAIKKIVVQ